MLLLSSVALMMALVSPAHAVPAESTLAIHGHSFSYYTNTDLTAENAAATRAIIVVHGSERNADTYYNTMDVLSRQQGAPEATVVISPHFKLATDRLVPDELTFTDEGWLRGDAATNDAEVSSFQVMDTFLKALIDLNHFPNLKTIIVTGHSAGGQLTQRYALGTQVEYSASQIHFRYIVVNPGSYMYLTEERPVGNNQYEIPQTSCAYNDYKFGLENLNAYQEDAFNLHSVSNYLARDIVYFLGEADTITEDIDQGCEARLQGNFRYERGRNFKTYLDDLFPEHNHHLLTAPGIGHTEWGMYSSPNGKKALFSDSL